MDILESGWTTHPRLIRKQYGWDARLVYDVLLDYAAYRPNYKGDWQVGEVVMNVGRIAKILHWSPDRIHDCIKTLKKAGFITTQREGNSGLRFFIIHYKILHDQSEILPEPSPNQAETKPKPVPEPKKDNSSLKSKTYDTKQKDVPATSAATQPEPSLNIAEQRELITNNNQGIEESNVDLRNDEYIDAVAELYREICVGFGKVQERLRVDKPIKAGIRKIRKDHGITIEEWRTLFVFIVSSEHYSGRGSWQGGATLRWLTVTRPSKFMATLETAETKNASPSMGKGTDARILNGGMTDIKPRN